MIGDISNKYTCLGNTHTYAPAQIHIYILKKYFYTNEYIKTKAKEISIGSLVENIVPSLVVVLR